MLLPLFGPRIQHGFQLTSELQIYLLAILSGQTNRRLLKVIKKYINIGIIMNV